MYIFVREPLAVHRIRRQHISPSAVPMRPNRETEEMEWKRKMCKSTPFDRHFTDFNSISHLIACGRYFERSGFLPFYFFWSAWNAPNRLVGCTAPRCCCCRFFLSCKTIWLPQSTSRMTCTQSSPSLFLFDAFFVRIKSEISHYKSPAIRGDALAFVCASDIRNNNNKKICIERCTMCGHIAAAAAAAAFILNQYLHWLLQHDALRSLQSSGAIARRAIWREGLQSAVVRAHVSHWQTCLLSARQRARQAPRFL